MLWQIYEIRINLTHELARNRYQLARRPKELAKKMLLFMDLIDPSQPCVKPIDRKMIQVWLAEAKFLSCFEDLFDLKFAST